MKFAALALAAILFVSCASSGGPNLYREDILASWEKGTFPVRVDNNVYEHVTVYVTNGGTRQRLGDCSGISRCWLRASKTTTKRILSDGFIGLGWRFFGGPPGLHAQGTLTAWDGLVVVLTLNRINWYMHSQHFGNREADE